MEGEGHGAGAEGAPALVDAASAERHLRGRFVAFSCAVFLLSIPLGVALGLRAGTLNTAGLWGVAFVYAMIFAVWARNRRRYRTGDAVLLLGLLNLLPIGLFVMAHSSTHMTALAIYLCLAVVVSAFLLGPRWAVGVALVDVALVVGGYLRFADEVRGTPLEEVLRLMTVRGVVVLALLALTASFFSRELRALIFRLTEANRGLRTSEEALAEFVREAPDGIVTLDGTGVIRRFNPAAEAITGLRASDVVGRGFLETGLLDPDQLADTQKLFARSMELGHSAPTEIRLRRPDGRGCVVEASGRVVTRAGGAPELHAVLREVTARKQLEEQLRMSQRLDAVGRLAGGVAHDFNNLLTVILTNAQSLAEAPGLPADRREEAADIVEAGNRATELTRQLLVFGRKQVLEPRVLDLCLVVEKMERLLRRLIPESVTITVQTAPGPVAVRADPTQLEQVLVNLVVNAKDAMPQGGALRIVVEELSAEDPLRTSHAVPAGDWAHLAVADTGHGIAADVASQVFEPFFSTKAPGRGTGLGLATVHGIVTQSQGHVWVDSEPGHGATFHVLLPASDEAPTLVSPAGAEVAARSGALCVLLVEDADVVREVTRRVLASGGHRVVTAASPLEALALARAHGREIDVLLTDVVMPEMNGPSLAAALRADRPDLPVLYISGYAGDALPADALEGPGVAFLAKPFSASALLRSLHDLTRPRPEGSSGPETPPG